MDLKGRTGGTPGYVEDRSDSIPHATMACENPMEKTMAEDREAEVTEIVTRLKDGRGIRSAIGRGASAARL